MTNRYVGQQCGHELAIDDSFESKTIACNECAQTQVFELIEHGERTEVVPNDERVDDDDDAMVDADVVVEELPSDEEMDDEELDAYACGEEKADGEPCSREVDGPNDNCWQHREE